ncbi:hypothetical protein ALC62_15371 [Cyphomyrmex costatus]|uniref:YqaJ viral recombinase domain-containing protein n=1 Tax=Cyphomyrmex costatus TaxID=456900 RepID=A0A151I7A1_9HYME|nr:hypothetical protein ALC62_15371 [Cyphomyrmex costatus]
MVKGQVCPEHRVRSSPYDVTATINEKEEKVENVQCHDCPASTEEQVLKVLERNLGQKLERCGLKLSANFPIFGASPDGIGYDFVVEIKCPSTDKGFKTFLPNGQINLKCKAQICLQMLFCNFKKGLFCVAKPTFEKDEAVETLWVSYDEEFTIHLINESLHFWKKNIFNKLLDSVMK